MNIYGIVATPWGRIGVTVSALGVHQVEFDAPEAPALEGVWADALAGYFAGQAISAELPVDIDGLTPFSRRVLDACRRIPFGTVRSYAQLAAEIGLSHAARAVGHALARNPVPIIIPCHRIVSSQGKLTGFLGGLDWKRSLLTHEGVSIDGDRVSLR